MFEVDTPNGKKYMVQLVGPKSYRMGSLMAMRGQTLTVSKRTRDYLVRKTDGAWIDFDPTPEEPVEELFPPQFGEAGGPSIDMDDIDPQANPALSMDQARALAAKGGEVASNEGQTGPVSIEDGVPGIDTADLKQDPDGAPEGNSEDGDISGADLKGGAAKPATGGASATKPAKPAQAKPKGGVKVQNAPKATAKAKPKETAVTVE